ncbi:MAG: glutamate--tRNA ligase [Candidatus Eiseniibacteriota bacterium]|jgi:glutamyl-tRNA synthetase
MRLRFAPSPTGYLHVGAARTALFNWLLARKHGGAFVLRIEDTDRERSTDEATRIILEGLEWLGLDWDEGPHFQSARLEAHRAAAAALLDSGHAYRDFTAADARPAADGAVQRNDAARAADPAQAAARAAAGEPCVVRFKVPVDRGRLEFEDLVQGRSRRHIADIEDFALLRPDGSPTYHLSVVVDDSDMGITHVVRGRDHRDNTFKQILLYEALGRPVPRFAHIPLILAPDRSKLSKRKHGDVVALTTYRDAGFLPEALCNYLALLGWSSGDDREFFDREELIAHFDLSGVQKSNAIYNFIEGHPTKWLDQKAFWMNAQYIRRMDLERLEREVEPWLRAAGLWQEGWRDAERDWLRRTLEALRERAFTMRDFALRGRPYFADTYDFEPKALRNLQKTEDLPAHLAALGVAFHQVSEWTAAPIESALRAFGEAHGVGSGHLINGVRAAVTGQTVGPGIFDALELIGRERVCQRLEAVPARVQSAAAG